jgi:hypothetical protein
MEDVFGDEGFAHRHTKLTALIIIVLVGFGLAYLVLPRVAPFFPLPDEEPTYSSLYGFLLRRRSFIYFSIFLGQNRMR